MNGEDKTAIIRACEGLLTELNKSIKSSFMYPPSHPSLKKSYEYSYNNLVNFISNAGEFTISVGKNGLIYEETPFGKDIDVLKKFSQDLALKNIQSLTFRETIQFEEYESLIALLAMDDKKFREAGGANRLFGGNNIKNITVKEMVYDGLHKDSAQGQDEEGAAGTAPKSPVEVEAPEEIDEKTREEELEKELESEINSYIMSMSLEKDYEKFKKILIKIVKLSEKLIDEGRIKHVIILLTALTREALPNKKRHREFQQLCFKAVKKLSKGEVIDATLNKFAVRDTKNRGELAALLKVIGSEAITPAINKLIEDEDAAVRRNLIQLVIGFKEAARPKVEIFLFDERWYVVRNMAMILGEIRSEKSLNPLSRVVNHSDFRVQREVIHALTKIGGKRVPAFFLRILEEAPQQLSLIIINSLGLLGDTTATGSLVDIATKRELFYRNYELRKQAINSLGRLKDQTAVDPLGKILLKGEFMGGIRNEDLRIDAAKALGRIGGQKAAEVLFIAAKKRNRNIKRAAEASLASMGFGYEQFR